MNVKKAVVVAVLPLIFSVGLSGCKFGSGGGTASTPTPPTSTTSQPGSFSISAPTAEIGQVVISWGASSGATSYTLKYGTTSGSYGTTVSTSATSPTTVSGLIFGTTYYFMVTAVNSVGSTNASAPVSDSPLGGMDCYAGSINSSSSGYYLLNASSANPISYLTNLTGSKITKISFPLVLQDPPATNSGGTAYNGDITLNVYSCVNPGSAPSTGTLLGSAPATYSHESGGVFYLSTNGAGTEGDLTDFSFASSPLTIPTSCSGGKYQLALQFTSLSGFASEYVLAPSESASSSCFLNISSSSTNVTSGTGNSYQAIVTVE